LDKDGDGKLDAEELKGSPGLLAARGRIDGDGDGQITAEELQKRFEKYLVHKIGAIAFVGSVTNAGEPVSGAEVALEPEPFFEGVLSPASGLTDQAGFFRVQVPGLEVPGAQPGIYRVRVSKKDPNGQELIPARFNRESVVGVEVAADSEIANTGLEIDLSK
jgi:hypothetical protein